MGKLVLEKRDRIDGAVIRIKSKQYRELKEVSKKTNLPVSVVASEMIEYALNNLEIKGEN